MADIKRILNKKSWTGRELGILEITNMAVMFKQALEGKKPQPIIPKDQLQGMINGITDRTQGQTFNGYISIHEWLSVKYNIAQSQLQQAQLQYKTLEDYITRVILAEDVFRYIEQLPAIMTQKQYDELKAARVEAFFKDEDGKELCDDVFLLIERFTNYYLRSLQAEPTKANPLKALKKKYSEEPVKSKLILSHYNEIMGEGYYTIDDGSGRRSDQMTNEEWQEALATPKMREALKTMRAGDGSGREYTQEIAQERIVERAKVIINGGTNEDADKAQQEADYKAGLATPVTWHTYTEPPKDLTKWDIIELGLLEFYPVDTGSGDSESDYKASMEDFAAEFKALVDIALSEIDSRYFKGEKKLAELPVSAWAATTINYRQLYEMGFYDFREDAEADYNVFVGNRRALYNGVAIVRESKTPGKSRTIDERGYYLEPEIQNTLPTFSLEAFFPEADGYAANVKAIETARNALLESYYFLIGYNLAIDMIAKYYDIPDITVFKAELSYISQKIDAYNTLVPLHYKRITDTDYRDRELKAKKLQALKDNFAEVGYKALEIPAENIEQAEELLPDFQAFKAGGAERFYNLICIMPREERGL